MWVSDYESKLGVESSSSVRGVEVHPQTDCADVPSHDVPDAFDRGATLDTGPSPIVGRSNW